MTIFEEHRVAVTRIQEQVKSFHEQKKHFRVYHGSTSSTRSINFQRDAIVDTSDMSRLFPVDTQTKTVQAEPKVPMDELAAHTLKHGLVPKIVMEFKGITAGGGFSGMSGESAMFKFGLFQNTVSEIEIVLGDGTLEKASRSYNTDLLEAAGGSLGTFGIVTLVTIELIDAKDFVDIVVTPISDVTTVPGIMEEAIQGDPDFIDGIFYRKGEAVMMIGNMVDKPKDKVLTTQQVHWFSDQVEARIKGSQSSSMSMKLVDYLFRYDHGAFWGGKLAFQHFHVPNNRITRRLADPFLDSRTCYHALHKTGLANEYVVQDFGIPLCTVVQFITFVNDEMPHLQLFLCPAQSAEKMHISSRMSPLVSQVSDQRVFGVGVYGRGPADPKAFAELNRRLEKRASELLGAKLLYARTYYTEEEFWTIYDRPSYDALRKKYRAETLPDVYQKLHADMSAQPKRRPIRGVIETVIDKAVGQRNYLLKK